MGIYIYSIDDLEWFEENEDGRGRLALALNAELHHRGLPPYTEVPPEVPFARGSGQRFEEKLVPPVDSFNALCLTHLSPEQTETLYGWEVLVPVSLEPEFWLPLAPDDPHESMIAGAPQVLPIAERMAALLELPPEVPHACDNLDLTTWFLDGPAAQLAAERPGKWCGDLDAAFYVAVYLRAAQHSLRRNCPMVYS